GNRVEGVLLTWTFSHRLLLPRLHHLPLLFRQQIAKMDELTCTLKLLTAVHDNLLAVDVARLIAHQECRQICQLLMCAEAPERIAFLGHLLQGLYRHEPRDAPCRRDRAR